MKALKANVLDYLDRHCVIKMLLIRERKETHRRQHMMIEVELTMMCFEDGGRSHRLMNSDSLQKLEKTETQSFTWKDVLPPEGTQMSDTFKAPWICML